ncbi:MAG: hypothetical protein EOP10_02225 [Proteobacteria bacterium]|nr:MAG: hypothetical protein EOP10_02225 [Pseudomonadota bacterium]
MKRLWLSMTLVLIACEGKNSKNADPTSAQKVSGPSAAASDFLSLQSFENCSVADSYIQTNIRRKLADQFAQQRSNLRYYGSSRADGAAPVAENDSASKESEGSASAPSDFSKTNTQVAGVDEPDMMKTNGTHIFTVSGTKVQIVQSWPANAMKPVSKIEIDGMPRNLFLTEDNKLVVASMPRIAQVQAQRNAPWFYYDQYDYAMTRLEIYDLTNIAAPTLEKTFHFRGQYLDMRRQGNLLRLVSSNSYAQLPEGIIQYANVYTKDGIISLGDFDRQVAKLQADNEVVLQKMSFKDWVLSQNQNWGGNWPGVSDDLLEKGQLDCSKIYASAALGEIGLTSITSLNLADSSVDQVSLLAPSNTIYASEASLYVALNYRSWWWGWGSDSGSKTFIHKFVYSSATPTAVEYQGSAMLDGYLNDQFSLDEHNGYLRVAITDDHHVSGISNVEVQPMFTTVNRILVLKPENKSLVVVGQTKDLAPGERIYSARFQGNKGYVVTFRQTDPLYTLDLSNPLEPKVTGELKVNGFSSYIHLIDDNHLLTVGQDADDNGRVKGLKIAVFDVTDPAAPVEKFKKVLNDAQSYSWSEAQYDHHAFTYFASRGLLGIPVGGYRSNNSNKWWDGYFSELQVFKIDLTAGISQKGAIAMNDLYQGQRLDWGYWWGGSAVQRSVFADDFIYAISSSGIKAVHGNDMMTAVGSVSFYP